MTTTEVTDAEDAHYDAAGDPNSYAALYATFGNPDDPGFAQTYLVSVTHHFDDQGDVTFDCHKAIADHLHNVWARMAALGKLGVIRTFDGCHVNRSIRGSSHKSMHAWGLAIDINAAQFPLGSTARQDHDLTVAFEAEGFFYGGDFHHRKDGMHYEYTGGAI